MALREQHTKCCIKQMIESLPASFSEFSNSSSLIKSRFLQTLLACMLV